MIKIPVTLDQFKEKEWREAKEEWLKKIKAAELPKDLESNPEMIIKTQHYLDILHNEASYYLSKYRTMYEDMTDYIEAIKYVYRDNGKNPEERKANAYKMLVYYPFGYEHPEAQNLIEIRNRIRDRYYFFRDCVMESIKMKDSALNTNIGASKIDARISSNFGAIA